MASLLAKKFTSVNIFFPSRHHYNTTCLIPLFHFSTQIQRNDDLSLMSQYLVSTFGFSEERAVRVTSHRNFIPIRTLDRPESVVRFLKDTGLTDIQIKNVIKWTPQLLSKSVSKTLEPRTTEIIAAGFTKETIIQLIRYSPIALTYSNILQRLQFWRNFLVNSEELLLKVIKGNKVLFDLDINKIIIPSMNLLREYGLSNQQITSVLIKSNCLIRGRLHITKKLLEQTENLGFQRGTGMFLHGLRVVASFKRETIERKIQFFKNTLNWSEEDVNSVVKKCPSLLGFSEENINSKIDFFIRKVGLDPCSVALNPTILTLSLERRLIPRHYVINALKSEGKKSCPFYTAICMPEMKFVEKFIVPYKKELPHISDSYAAFFGGKMPT